MSLGEAFEAAFATVFKGPGDAKLKEAQDQSNRYGQQEWKPGVPARDVLDRKIVFKDAFGFRYTVTGVRPNGSHVRTYFDATRPVQSVEVEGRAPNAADAEALVNDTLINADMGKTMFVSQGQYLEAGVRWYWVRKRTEAVPLD